MNRKHKVIIIGGGGSGKDHLAQYLIERGFVKNIAYTTRPQRELETEGEDYYFISSDSFETKINEGFWHEYNIFIPEKRWYYGSSKPQFESCNLFIKEPHGLSLLNEEERKECFVIYLNIDEHIRRERMSSRRDVDNVKRRIKADRKNFENFTDYDYEVTDEKFKLEKIFNLVLSVNNYYL